VLALTLERIMRLAKFLLLSVICFAVISTVAQVPATVNIKSVSFETNNPVANISLPTGGTVATPQTSDWKKYNIIPPGSSSEIIRSHADEDIRRHREQNQQQQKELDQIFSNFSKAQINYELPFKDHADKQFYFEALEYFKKVLSGEKPMNLEASVFIVEKAFDPSLNYKDFNAQLSTAVNVIGLKMSQDKININDNVGKIMTTFKFFSDTLKVASKNSESSITTYPKTYDFEDFWGRGNYKKMFVSKLMREGSGQCHSLPLYFLILCERINANASLAFAPNHSFVKFQDARGIWRNIELTNNMLASDHFMIQSGYIKAEAIQSKIYLQPLTKKQTIVQCLNDLALGYSKKYGYDSFVSACVSIAIDHDSNSISAHQINANYFNMLDNYIRYQYKSNGLTKDAYLRDTKAQEIYQSAMGANKFIEKLGYSDMPQDAYEAWLKAAQSESNKQQHNKELKVLGGMIEKK
jgi:hypothetical protein